MSRWLHTTRARLTLLFGGTAVATGLAVGLLADELLTRQLTDLSGQSLMNSSQPIALALSQGMLEREREITLLSHLPMVTRPEVGGSRPAMTLKSVVLPAPFGPISPVIEPVSIFKEAPSTAWKPPKCL